MTFILLLLIFCQYTQSGLDDQNGWIQVVCRWWPVEAKADVIHLYNSHQAPARPRRAIEVPHAPCGSLTSPLGHASEAFLCTARTQTECQALPPLVSQFQSQFHTRHLHCLQFDRISCRITFQGIQLEAQKDAVVQLVAPDVGVNDVDTLLAVVSTEPPYRLHARVL
jgi:hypothetical protein